MAKLSANGKVVKELQKLEEDGGVKWITKIVIMSNGAVLRNTKCLSNSHPAWSGYKHWARVSELWTVERLTEHLMKAGFVVKED